jgi:hypothetical protein
MSLVLLGSTSGSVTLQEPAIAGSTVIDLPATSGTMAVLPTATSVLPEASGGTGTTTGYYGFKNRIINGAMVIDQRNAGASVATTTTASLAYCLDRWGYLCSQASKFTVQQTPSATETGYATRVAAGFTNYLSCTVGASANVTVGSTDYFGIAQTIEGFSTADFAWGTASAKTVTFSFWVNSSVTGTFGASIRNSAVDRSYPFTYTINSANTWEQKTVTIAGDTTGTWPTNSARSMIVQFNLGYGSTFSNTPNAWVAGNYGGATGSVNLISTNSATFYITGVQLEKGSTATSFDYRPYGTELALCQRYYEKSYNIETVPGTTTNIGARVASNGAPFGSGTRNFIINNQFLVAKRATPTTLTFYDSNASNASGKISGYSSATQYTVSSSINAGTSSLGTYITTTTTPTVTEPSFFHFTADAEL